IEALREKLESGEIEKALGPRLAQHVRQALTPAQAMLVYHADDICAAIGEFLTTKCGVRRVEVAGDYRRRVEVVEELAFVIDAAGFASAVAQLRRFGGRTPLLMSRRTE